MSDDRGLPPTSKRETALRVLMLGAIYAAAITFVVALSPSMGLVTHTPASATAAASQAGSVASATEPGHTVPR